MTDMFNDRGVCEIVDKDKVKFESNKADLALSKLHNKIDEMEHKIKNLDSIEMLTNGLNESINKTNKRIDEALEIGKENKESIDDINISLKIGIGIVSILFIGAMGLSGLFLF